jgi:hypothetical protein
MGIQPVRRAILLAVTLLAGALLVGCASAPVQEMSDARQAIRAAQNAGATQKAPAQLQVAQSLLASAEQSLQKRMYRAAKRDAVAARNEAVDAMQAASGRPNHSNGTPEKSPDKS